MQTENRHKNFYQFLSILLTLTLVISLISPAKTVSAAAAPVFTKASQTIMVGETYKVSMKNKLAGANYTWKSTDKAIAKVNQKGVVTGLKKGTATIRCNIKTKAKSYTLECKITVKKPAEEIFINNKIDYLIIGETYDLNRSLKPSGANEATTWSSSATDIISIDKAGKITAKKQGMSTITAATKKVSDSVTIYVVEQETKEITKADVVDGKITLSDKSYGTLSISSSVGTAAIALNNVMVGGTLTMESGAAYTVTTKECNINKVDAVNAVVKSFAIGDAEEEKATPSIVAGKGSIIVSIDSECNISVKQSNGAVIQSFSVVTKADGTIEVALEGFKGDLVIDSQSQSAISISTTSCEMTSATVKNATEGQSITLTDSNAGTEQASTIGTVSMAANAALKVDVKTEEVVIARELTQADVTISQPVAKLTNEGSNTTLVINSEVTQVTSTGAAGEVSLGDLAKVTNFKVEGAKTNVGLRSGAQLDNMTSLADNTKVNVSEGASIQKISAYGNSSTIEGNGKVQQAIVTGNDTKVNTEGTTVQVALGTSNVSIKGVEVKEEDKIAIATPTPAPTVAPKPKATVTPKVTIKPKATVTPKVTTTPSPKPTTTPVPTVTQAPTNDTPYVPSTPQSPPTPTPKPTEKEKLTGYHKVLGDLHSATTKLIAAKNSANYTAVQKAFTALKDKLNLYGELDIACKATVVSADTVYLYDYADYLEQLIAQGKDYGLPIRSYYESAAASTQTYAQALSAANRAVHMVDRVNKEKVFMTTDVTNIFKALTGSAADFDTAMKDLIKDQGELIPYASEKSQYYQKEMRSYVTNDSYMLERSKAAALTYFEALNCFINISDYYEKLQTDTTLVQGYLPLVNQVIDALPPVTLYYGEDGSYQGADYDDTGKHEAIVAAIDKLWNAVTLSSYFSEDVSGLSVKGPYEDQIIRDIIRQLYTTHTYKDGSKEILNYYRQNRASIEKTTDFYIINSCVASILWTVRDITRWNKTYLKKNTELTQNVINAAKANEEDKLYTAVVALYDAKLHDTDGSESEWKNYTPVEDAGKPTVDKTYLLSYIRSKLQPLSDYNEKGGKINSKLYDYTLKGLDATGEDLDQAIYIIKNSVEECQLRFKQQYDMIKGRMFALMEALENNGAKAAYDAYHDLYEYTKANYTEAKDFSIRTVEYAPIYYRLLREAMFTGNHMEEFSRFYDMHVSDTEYSRYISEVAYGAMWGCTWLLKEVPEVKAQLEDQYAEYSKWLNDVETSLYPKNRTEWETSVEALIQMAKSDPGFAAYYKSTDFPDMQIKSELYDEYRNQILEHLKDNENHTDGTNTWVNPMYVYAVMKSDGKVPSDNLLRDLVNDLMWILIDTNRDLEMFHKTNTLYDALLQNNPTGTYTALSDMVAYVNFVNPNMNGIMKEQEAYAIPYYNEIKGRMANTVTGGAIATVTGGAIVAFLNQYNTNPTKKYSSDLRQITYDAVYDILWYTQGSSDAEAAMTNAYQWEQIRLSLHAVLQGSLSNPEAMIIALNSLAGYAVTKDALRAHFSEEELGKRTVTNANVANICNSLITNTSTEATACNQFSKFVTPGIFPSYGLIENTFVEIVEMIISNN